MQTSPADYWLYFTCTGMEPSDFGFSLGEPHDEGVLECCYIMHLDRYLKIRSFGDRCWTWCADPVVFGVLVDMDRGCVTFRLNDMDGPCVRFPPTAQWREGVSLTVDEFPREDTSPRVVISCATPPAPPSLLAAAANPFCVGGPLPRGTLYADGNRRDQPESDY